MNITVRDLFDAGVHFGHQTKRWNPKSKPYVFDHRQGISIMDLGKTFECLENASSFIEDTIAGGGNILMVGTKRQAQEVMREAAVATEMPFCVSRWLGGTLTNFSTILKSIAKYKKYLSMETDGSLDKLPKKELAVVRREMSRMNRNFEGLLEMPELPDAIFIIDIKREDIAVAEARRLGIPVIALVDTNSDPTLVDYPIPGNDDAVKSIRIIVETIMEALQNGMSKREANKTAQTFVAEPTMESYSEQVAAEAEENMEEITVTIDPELMVDQEGKRESSEESQS
ncbi:MAG: 30S ribosomal protein S2 [Opitutales bacterium]|jgi:small subunit ribosomal protein S2|nr:30S ribosomal protein S2 [Opitutales bacterium]MDG2168257.1 30S ribosomal protein S2 [Opitutales bacterium]